MEPEKSKSQKKRDADALLKLGYQLTQLNNTQLDSIPLPEQLKEAILHDKTIKSHSAKKRHLQYIGRIMRSIEDIEPIQDAYQKIVKGLAADTAKFHLAEKWRERLISDDEHALARFLNNYQCDDIQQLRQLQSKAIKEKTLEKKMGHSKALLQLIIKIIG